MNWAALLLVGLGVLGLGMAVTGGYAPLAKLLFGWGVTPPPAISEPNSATHPITPSGSSSPPSAHGRPATEPGTTAGITLALQQVQSALAAYAPGVTL